MLTTATLLTSNDHRLRTLHQPHPNPNQHKPRSKHTSHLPLSSLTSTALPTRPRTATTINVPSPTINPDHQSITDQTFHSVNTLSQAPNLSPTQSLRRASSTPVLLHRVPSCNSKRKTRAGTLSPVELRSAPTPQTTTSALSKPDPSPTLKDSSIPPPSISNLQKKAKRKSEMKSWEASGSVAATGTPTFSPSFPIPSTRTQGSSPELGPRTPIASARVKSNDSPLQSEPPIIDPSPAALRRSKAEERRRKKHIDFTTYPQSELILRLATLLQQIAVSNDRIDEPRSATGATAMSEWSLPRGSRRPSTGSALSSPGATWNRRTVKATERPDQSPTVAYFQQHQNQSETRSGNGTPNLEEESFEFGQLRASNGLHPNHLTTASKTALTSPSALLTFHAKHVPQITIEAYLRRIQKYCPMTNEVFVGVLVYLDRMSGIRGPGGEQFVIDSWNVHRFLIATVTATSKFFSDVFYTNSRYAKVGGLPLKELDQLELQFLLLNDFRLMISNEELNKYGAQLLAPFPNENQDDEEEDEVESGNLDYRPLSWSEESSEATITPGSPGSVVTASSFNSS
ncbi:uncharacterized protein MELLADRAFT_88491 [Melampsora larici-populina 98AG31]|uniref:Cyclin-domain-containing protein n=1 Tax=Melampsora larici-populina (strain 98AG31 / pathotype 3-4-7) TaxID=747676 RepID=F4RRX1_MELLP|nr:uncharacterized protein MELLADRAFT_88491 [Melampsora larici-populina 98AG31]EGG04752.1 hypothetical protein MELLADRAFT_88491 [Melampsora larici-populina 98AG31]